MNINFIGNKNKFFAFSIILTVIVIIATFVNGVKMDIQFQGGYIFTYSYEGEIYKDSLEKELAKKLNQDVSVQKTTDIGSGINKLVISFGANKALDANVKKNLKEIFDNKFSVNKLKEIQVSNVDSAVGKEFFTKCMVAVAAAAVFIIIYIAIRFKKIGGLSAGVMAVIALIHDVTMIYGTFVILKMPLSDSFIAGCLMILGYSINDTIIIYDRIRENKKIYGSKMSIGDLVNKSINQSFNRTINTTFTTVMSSAIVLVVALIYGVSSIVPFILPLMVGMITGAYSTICIAGPLWVVWQNKKRNKRLAKIEQ